MPKQAKILISGYLYVDEIALKTFEYYPEQNSVSFLLPAVWPIKNGKHIFHPIPSSQVKVTKAFFTHSNYPIIGGLFKGWMPAFPFILARQRPSIVLSTSEPNLLTTLYQGIFTKLSGASHIIFTWENVPYTKKFKGLKGIFQRAIVHMNLYFADACICGTERSREIMKEVTSMPLAVISSSGIDTEFLIPTRNRNSNDPVTFCFIGAIGYRKGVHLIVGAFAQMLKQYPNTRLVIAGSGEYEQELQQIISTAGVEVERLSWLDRDGVRSLLNRSDVFVYPSIPHGGWEEQFGYAILEASAMELPIISTRSGSIPEVVADGETGILIESNNVPELVKAMSSLSQDMEKRVALGEAGRKFVLSRYSHQAIAQKYYQFFNQF